MSPEGQSSGEGVLVLAPRHKIWRRWLTREKRAKGGSFLPPSAKRRSEDSRQWQQERAPGPPRWMGVRPSWKRPPEECRRKTSYWEGPTDIFWPLPPRSACHHKSFRLSSFILVEHLTNIHDPSPTTGVCPTV